LRRSNTVISLSKAVHDYRVGSRADWCSVHMKEIREDLIDAYHYVQKGVNQDLREAGTSATIDGTRCSFMGWSAGGGNTLWVVSLMERLKRNRPVDSLGKRRNELHQAEWERQSTPFSSGHINLPPEQA
jgi:hypothetical protein